MNFYIRQIKGYELGNWINCTPCIKYLFNKYNKKIPVLFETKYIEELYVNWNFIQPIDDDYINDNDLKMLFHSGDFIEKEEREYISKFNQCCTSIGMSPPPEVPHTFVPVSNTNYRDYEYAVIASGCIPDGYWEDKKGIDNEVYKKIIDKIDIPIVLVGNSNDYDKRLKFFKTDDMEVCLDDINEVANVINGCKYMISNDTGLYHMASSFEKPVFVMWNDTPFERNISPSNNSYYSKSDWVDDFDNFPYNKVKLNLGCGNDIRDGYINLDKFVKGPQIHYADIEKLNYNDNSVDEILASDIIEHFDINDVWNVLAEWCRVLKSGGKIIIRTPDIEVICSEYFSQAKEGKISWDRLSRIINGGQDNDGNYHHVSLSFDWLKLQLEKNNMVDIIKIRNINQNMDISAIKK